MQGLKFNQLNLLVFSKEEACEREGRLAARQGDRQSN
jgi:hypothetical protein